MPCSSPSGAILGYLEDISWSIRHVILPHLFLPEQVAPSVDQAAPCVIFLRMVVPHVLGRHILHHVGVKHAPIMILVIEVWSLVVVEAPSELYTVFQPIEALTRRHFLMFHELRSVCVVSILTCSLRNKVASLVLADEVLVNFVE